MKQFVVYFAQTLLSFRLAELNALAVIENVKLKYDPRSLRVDASCLLVQFAISKPSLCTQSPFLVVEMDSVDDAKKLLTRSILIKEIIELWAHADSLDALLEEVRAIPIEQHNQYLHKRFKFNVSVFGSTLTIAQQVQQIERFSFLPYLGDIDLKTPEVVFTLYQDFYDFPNQGLPSPENPIRLFWGPFVAAGDRALIQKYDLKKRDYLGTTSMDAELSLIMSNVALVKSGSFVLDPFVGTGSFLFTSSHFGAFTMGADIDGRQIRGKDNKNIDSNAKQYDLTHRILGTVVCDIAHHPWRATPFWDAIICDPPYGVRAGAKKISINPKTPPKTSTHNPDGSPKLPQTVPYPLPEVLTDLTSFAAVHLVPGGRLVYWLPTITETYTPRDFPRHSRLRLLDNCEQNFNKWARRLIVMEKLRDDELDLSVDDLAADVDAGVWSRGGIVDSRQVSVDQDGVVSFVEFPAHAQFRKVYFTK
ncbi:hypothetical protein HDU83_003901 [Entophlyctis luteolus]|nr:hypothetical protein HDU83_003901 [Entophlyctis luteolus]